MSGRIFDNDLVAIRKRKVRLIPNKPVLMHDFHYDYIRNKYSNKSRSLVTALMVWCMKILMKILVKRKKNDLKTLVVSKLKDKTTDVLIIIIIFFGWKPWIFILCRS